MTPPIKGTSHPWVLLPESPEQSVAARARDLESACAAAMQLLASTSEGRLRLLRVDPVPASTMRIIRGLAASHHARATPDSR